MGKCPTGIVARTVFVWVLITETSFERWANTIPPFMVAWGLHDSRDEAAQSPGDPGQNRTKSILTSARRKPLHKQANPTNQAGKIPVRFHKAEADGGAKPSNVLCYTAR